MLPPISTTQIGLYAPVYTTPSSKSEPPLSRSSSGRPQSNSKNPWDYQIGRRRSITANIRSMGFGHSAKSIRHPTTEIIPERADDVQENRPSSTVKERIRKPIANKPPREKVSKRGSRRDSRPTPVDASIMNRYDHEPTYLSRETPQYVPHDMPPSTRPGSAPPLRSYSGTSDERDFVGPYSPLGRPPASPFSGNWDDLWDGGRDMDRDRERLRKKDRQRDRDREYHPPISHKATSSSYDEGRRRPPRNWDRDRWDEDREARERDNRDREYWEREREREWGRDWDHQRERDRERERDHDRELYSRQHRDREREYTHPHSTPYSVRTGGYPTLPYPESGRPLLPTRQPSYTRREVKMREDDARKKAEDDVRKKAEDDARKKAEDDARKKAEDAHKLMLEAAKKAEEMMRKEAEVKLKEAEMKKKEEQLKEDEARNKKLKEQIAHEEKRAKETIKKLEEEMRKKELQIQEREAAVNANIMNGYDHEPPSLRSAPGQSATMTQSAKSTSPPFLEAPRPPHYGGAVDGRDAIGPFPPLRRSVSPALPFGGDRDGSRDEARDRDWESLMEKDVRERHRGYWDRRRERERDRERDRNLYESRQHREREFPHPDSTPQQEKVEAEIQLPKIPSREEMKPSRKNWHTEGIHHPLRPTKKTGASPTPISLSSSSTRVAGVNYRSVPPPQEIARARRQVFPTHAAPASIPTPQIVQTPVVPEDPLSRKPKEQVIHPSSGDFLATKLVDNSLDRTNVISQEVLKPKAAELPSPRIRNSVKPSAPRRPLDLSFQVAAFEIAQEPEPLTSPSTTQAQNSQCDTAIWISASRNPQVPQNPMDTEFIARMADLRRQANGASLSSTSSTPWTRQMSLIRSRASITSNLFSESFSIASLPLEVEFPPTPIFTDETPKGLTQKAELPFFATQTPKGFVPKNLHPLKNSHLPNNTTTLLNSSSDQHTPTPTGLVRRGYWNRRGDHLTPESYVVFPPLSMQYPEELRMYPFENQGYQDHYGSFIAYVRRPELPQSLPKNGKPPERPYESFVSYV